jgi:hypothetical protein
VPTWGRFFRDLITASRCGVNQILVPLPLARGVDDMNAGLQAPRPQGESNACSSGSLECPRTAAARFKAGAATQLRPLIFLTCIAGNHSARSKGIALSNRLTKGTAQTRSRNLLLGPLST